MVSGWNKLAYVSDRSGIQVYILDIKRGSSERISRIGSENVAPDWDQWMVGLQQSARGRYRVVIVDAGSSYGAHLALDQADYEDPSWAPDGRHIIASRTIAYRSAIYLLDTGRSSDSFTLR